MLNPADQPRRRFRFHKPFWAFQVLAWFGYGFLKMFAYPTSVPDAVYVALKSIALSCLLHWFYQRLFERAVGFKWTAALSLPACLVIAVYSLSISMHLNVRGWVLHPDAEGWLGSSEALLHTWLLFVAWSAFYFGGRYALTLADEREQLVQALQRADQARARMLRYQLNPHFLFNTLNGVRALVAQQPARARDMVSALAGYLRFVLRAGEHETISLQEELEAVEHYLAIEKIRFEDRLEYSLSTHIANPMRRVPPLLMQPLVENAVKHGMRTCNGVLKVVVTVDEQTERLLLRVCNTGRWAQPRTFRPAADGQGVGLHNIGARLQQHYPDRHQIDWRAEDNEVTVEIIIEDPPDARSTAADSAVPAERAVT